MRPDKRDLMVLFADKPGALDLYLAFEKVLYARFSLHTTLPRPLDRSHRIGKRRGIGWRADGFGGSGLELRLD